MGDDHIWRVAQALIDQHGDQAEAVAAGRTDKAVQDSDQEGERFWRRAVAAIRDLRHKGEKGSSSDQH